MTHPRRDEEGSSTLRREVPPKREVPLSTLRKTVAFREIAH